MMKPAQTLALAALLLAGTGASAQDTDGSDADMEVVEEIIVTAFRRAQALQDMAADGALRARLFAKNATDEDYLNNVFAANVGGGRFGTWAMPRQIGFEVTREFGG